MLIITTSYIVNIAVAGMMGTLLFLNLGERITKVFGENTAARQILACLYLSIAIFSTIGLFNHEYFIQIALVLFPLQIVYKLLTLIAVKDKKNPVPYYNLGISILHMFSIWFIVSNGL
jgi:hypothetical protein